MPITVKRLRIYSTTAKTKKANITKPKTPFGDINVSELKVIRKLGTGMLGTTYLVEYRGKQYAQKIQHILPKDIHKNYKNDLWRELDLYEYINTLNPEEQQFFTRLHGFKIFDNCAHNQILERPFKVDYTADNPFVKRLNLLDQSPWCATYLLDYKGETTLDHYLANNKLKPEQYYSICLQVCKIIHTLYKGGYSHNDLHPGNIMLSQTNKPHFQFMGKNIPYNRFAITAIDYGEVLHRKFKGYKYEGWLKTFITDRERWLFDEMFYDTMAILDGTSILINDCKKAKKLTPFERKIPVNHMALKMIVKHHTDFFITTRDKYIKLYPAGAELFNYCIDKLLKKNKPFDEYKEVMNNKNKDDLYAIINRIKYEFQVLYPTEFRKYYKWCSVVHNIIPTEDMLEILSINNMPDYVNYFISKVSI